MIEKVNRILPQSKNAPAFVLSLGLAFVFMYAGVATLLHPGEWAGYVPGFLAGRVNLDSALRAMAVFQVVLALWLLSGRLRKYAAALAALLLAGIVAADFSQLIITFRDVGLLCAALALYLLEK